MKQYEITLRADEKSFLDVCANNAGLVVSVRLLNADAAPVKKKFMYANGVRNKGITSHALIDQIFSDKKIHTRAEVQKKFVERGFSKNSHGPAIYGAECNGKIKPVGDDAYVASDAMPLLQPEPHDVGH